MSRLCLLFHKVSFKDFTCKKYKQIVCKLVGRQSVARLSTPEIAFIIYLGITLQYPNIYKNQKKKNNIILKFNLYPPPGKVGGGSF